MKPQVISLIEKENKSFIILLPSVLWIDATIIDNDTPNHFWMTLQEIGWAYLGILFTAHRFQTQKRC